MNKQEYNLEERTLNFSKRIVYLCRNIKIRIVNKNIIEQLLKSGTSIGANYTEANGACSKKDFKNKIAICKKESKETKYWLLLLKDIDKNQESKLIYLLREVQEFILIFSKIFSSSNNKN